jgi:glycerol-3-phosphate dehydrogenase
MLRDIPRLTTRRFDVLIIGGGIQGLAIAYDAAQRGLATALIERDDFGSGSSFNHAKTVHGGLRSLQTGDVAKARFSIRERRAMARIAPNFVTPLRFMMATTTALTRSRAALSIGFGLDAVVGHDRNEDVVPWLHLPAGRVVPRAEYDAAFGPNASRTATGGATWCDYHMPESDRLTLAFARAATTHGAVIANYIEAAEPLRHGSTITGVIAHDRVSGEGFDIEARLVISAAGAYTNRWIAALGGRLSVPLLKAMNVVTRRPAGPVALGAPTSEGRLLLIMPWHGRALIGTSHSEGPVEAGNVSVSQDELVSFLDEINNAFPALALTAEDVTLVHRGVVPAERNRAGVFGLMAHHRIVDHHAEGVEGALSVMGVKYTTARGVAEQVVDRACNKLGVARIACRTGTELLPGAFAEKVEDETERARRNADGLIAPECVAHLVRTSGSAWRDMVDMCANDPSLANAVAPAVPVIRASVAHAVRREMARTLVDVVVRRTGLGAAGHPGGDAANACAEMMAHELDWDASRIAAELHSLRSFYAPVRVS